MKTIHGDDVHKVTQEVLEAEKGIFRLAPNWIPRSWIQPGRRLKLAPQDIYALGGSRGGICERWFASTMPVNNAGAPPDEGLSYVVHNDRRFTFRDAVACHGAAIVGEDIWAQHGCWPVFTKFYDHVVALPMGMHQNAEQAALVGREGKPEGHYYPGQLNAVENAFPYTFFGLEPSTTKGQVRQCLERWEAGDNGILDLSKAYRIRPGTGWLIGPGILHAAGPQNSAHSKT